MNRNQTIAASAAVSGALISAGRRVDGRLGSGPVFTVGSVAAAGAYLAGTYMQNLPLFGTVARPAPTAGESSFSLTFDDGPDPRHTREIAEILASRGQHATFFVLGRAVRAYPEVIRELAAGGHEIACHGDDHRVLGFARPGTIRTQITAWEQAVEAALGRPGSRLLRAPHGVRSPWLVSVARRRGYAVCGWDGSVFDTAEPGVEVIVERVARLLRPGQLCCCTTVTAPGVAAPVLRR